MSAGLPAIAGRAGAVLARAAARAIPTLIAVAILSFLLLRSAPGDAVDALAAETGGGNAASVAAWRHDLGLDRSLAYQLLTYLGHLARFDLGFSPIYNMPVARLILQRLPATILLMSVAMAIALSFGVAAGVFMARHEGRAADRLLGGLLQMLYAIPAFCIGLLLILLFSIHLGWFPIGDAETIAADKSGLALWGDRLRHLVLPVVTLSAFFLAVYARMVRSAMIEIAERDYIRAARARGVPPHLIVWKHMLRNALLPVVTVAGNHAGAIISGAVTVETVFNWPGMGRLAYEAVLKRDFTVVIGVLLLSAAMVIVANLIVDLAHAWIDPRIEQE